MSILNTKDIYAFAKLINTTVETPSGEYSTAGTVTKINEDIEYVGNGGTEKTAEVALDGGVTCTASYNGIIVAEEDRVAVTIKNNVATITENYTNPNGNTIISGQTDYKEFKFTQKNGTSRRAIVTITVDNLPSGYKITGIKSIDLWGYVDRPEEYGGPGWVSLNTNLADDSGHWNSNATYFASQTHLVSFVNDGNTITLVYGGDGIPETRQYKVAVTYVAILSSAYSEQKPKEENNG